MRIGGFTGRNLYQKKNISENKTWDSQVSDFIYLEVSDAVMALCDQWWILEKKDVNKSRYLFLPLYFDPQTGDSKMKYYEKWNPLQSIKFRKQVTAERTKLLKMEYFEFI